ncbi:ComF family protein [Micromonospora craterilacus]|uniref:ComF family protein n=1 Tax=Micromonospora craterilacus TaxID=1655439 RepID=A0A2W2E4Q8_9ACTN|nr:ComF family protein [Micromonospora craterilacus]
MCYSCASLSLKPPPDRRCPVCDQAVGVDEVCSNSLCNSPERRFFDWTIAVALKEGALANMIHHVKDGETAWCTIFARVILGYLYKNPAAVRRLGAIIPNPAWLPPGADPRADHAHYTIEQARDQDERQLPFVVDPPLIVKTRQTDKMRSTTSAAERRRLGQQVYEALRVPDPSRVKGKEIMVYDDVFTSGTTLNAAARRLKESGATKVYGLSLARQTWRS